MALGLVLGLVGSVTTKLFGLGEKALELKARKLDYEHEKNRWSHDKDMFKMQSQAKVAETEQEAFLLTTKGSYDGLEASMQQQTEALKGTSKWVRNVVSMVRPVLTFTFVGIVVYISVTDNPDNYRAAGVAAAIDLAMMSVAWWFGDRSTKRVVESMRGGHIRGAGGHF